MESYISLPYDIVCQHRWFLRVAPGNNDHEMDCFETLFQDFALLGQQGAFVAVDSDDTNCSMKIARQNRVDDKSMELLVDVAYCDLRYARLLRNAVFALGETIEIPVTEFRIHSTHRKEAEIAMTAALDPSIESPGEFYPPYSTQLGPPIAKQVPTNHRSGRRAWLQCSNPLTKTLTEDLLSKVNLWSSVLDVAYPNSEKELRNGESMILNVEGSQHDDYTFEVLIDRFIAAEAAFHSLMNLLVRSINRENNVLQAVLE